MIVTSVNVSLRLNEKISFDFINEQSLSIRQNKKLLVYAVMYKNLQILVGLQWRDVIVETAGLVSSQVVEIILLWVLMFVLIVVSVTVEFYWHKYWSGFQITQYNLLHEYYNNSILLAAANSRSTTDYGSTNNMNQHSDNSDKINNTEQFWLVFWKEFMDLLVYGMSLGGVYGLAYTISYVVFLFYFFYLKFQVFDAN